MNNRRSRTYPLAICAMLSAIILLLAFTPLGLIDLPLIKATILHVPVIIGAVLLGWRKGALLGGVFGLASLVKNTIAPSALSFAFSPFIPVPGTDRGSIWALVICLIPRILTGITPALVYAGIRWCFRKKNIGRQHRRIDPGGDRRRADEYGACHGADLSGLPPGVRDARRASR